MFLRCTKFLCVLCVKWKGILRFCCLCVNQRYLLPKCCCWGWCIFGCGSYTDSRTANLIWVPDGSQHLYCQCAGFSPLFLWNFMYTSMCANHIEYRPNNSTANRLYVCRWHSRCFQFYNGPPSSEPDIHQLAKSCPHIIVHWRWWLCSQSPPPIPVLGQMNPLHTLHPLSVSGTF